MKTLTRKYAGLVVVTALLGMPLTHAVANEKASEVQDVVSDSWITSKVKSVFLSNVNISGLDIKVETVDGGDLLSHGCAVPSARLCLTSLFGMGRGGTTVL